MRSPHLDLSDKHLRALFSAQYPLAVIWRIRSVPTVVCAHPFISETSIFGTLIFNTDASLGDSCTFPYC